MRVLLISPTWLYEQKPNPTWIPLGIAYVASALQQAGHSVSIFDRIARLYRLENDINRVNTDMLEHIKQFKPDLIGLKSISPLIYDTVESVSLIRSIFAGPIVAGGHHATAMPELTLEKISELNGVIEGEGEIALTHLANGENPDAIPGLWWKHSPDDICHTPKKQIEHLDQLPFPALDLLDMGFYTKPSIQSIRGHYLSSISMITSRGCLNSCDFCAESITYGKGIRYHSPEYVIRWITKILNNYKIEGIYFFDNDFLIDKTRAEKICTLLISEGFHRKIKWAIQTRADRIDIEILQLLKKAGCVLIEFGVESSLQQNLERMRKQSTVSVSENAIALCRQVGISAHAYMISGFGDDEIFEKKTNLRWLKRVNPHSFSMSILKNYPGTKLYARAGNRFFEENNWHESDITSYYKNSFTPESLAEMHAWIKLKIDFRLYEILNYCLHLYKSNTAPKLLILFFKNIKKKGLFRINVFKHMVGYYKFVKGLKNKQSS